MLCLGVFENSLWKGCSVTTGDAGDAQDEIPLEPDLGYGVAVPHEGLRRLAVRGEGLGLRHHGAGQSSGGPTALITKYPPL